MDSEEILDEISTHLRLENWFEGKTLTVMLSDEDGKLRLAKLQLMRVLDKPSATDLRGEP